MISPPSSHILSTWFWMVLFDRPDSAKCSRKGLKHSTSFVPSGRSSSTPIQRSGHSERSRQSRQYGNSAAGVAGGELGFVFICVSPQSIHAPSQNFEPVPSHPGICLWASPFHRRRAVHCHSGTAAETIRRHMLGLSSTRARLQSVSHAAAV